MSLSFPQPGDPCVNFFVTATTFSSLRQLFRRITQAMNIRPALSLAVNEVTELA